MEIEPARLSAAMHAAGMNQSQLAHAVGVKQPSIGRLLSGETRTTRAIERIASALNTTVDYLRGKGEDVIVTETRTAFRPFPTSKPLNDLVDLEEIDMRYGLGGAFLDQSPTVQRRPFSREWLRSISTTSPDHLFWSTGDGDSMEPTIRSGEIMLIDRSQDTPRSSDGIWAVAMGDIGMIKRLRPMPDGSIEIHSDNQFVPPMKANDGELHVIGRVVAVVRKL